ncbi:MAG: hypothetical protein ACOX7K_01710 [Oscillospiraceae bacterium]|jgi:hypothetical protein
MAGKRIRTGYYWRYDGKVIHLVTVGEETETGEETVILRFYSFSDAPRYYTMSKKSFCGFVEVNGERKARYRQILKMKINAEIIANLTEDGLRGPMRKEKRERDAVYDSRVHQNAPTYHAYAKNLCVNYRFDLAKYPFCVNEKRYAAITRSDFAMLREDLLFLDNALKTVLRDHQDYFRERFVDGMSIRKYAEAHQMDRGSVDYLQKKFLTSLTQLLKERDEAEGKCRLHPKTN